MALFLVRPFSLAAQPCSSVWFRLRVFAEAARLCVRRCFSTLALVRAKMQVWDEYRMHGDVEDTLLQSRICRGEDIFGRLRAPHSYSLLMERWAANRRMRSAMDAPRLIREQPRRFPYLAPHADELSCREARGWVGNETE